MEVSNLGLRQPFMPLFQSSFGTHVRSIRRDRSGAKADRSYRLDPLVAGYVCRVQSSRQEAGIYPAIRSVNGIRQAA